MPLNFLIEKSNRN